MSDLDWDDEEFEVPDLAAEAAKKITVTDSQFADEDVEDDEETGPKKPYGAEKKVTKKVATYVDDTLDDPVAEKARKQKLVEAADLEAAKELFGTDGDDDLDLTTYNPKSEKEFIKFGTLVATKYLTPVNENAFYKEAIKSFIKSGCKCLTAADVKEVEAAIVAVRNDKVREEKVEAVKEAKAAIAAKAPTGKKKKFLNQGTKGGDTGLEDYKYSNYSVDDEYDFM